MSEPPTTDADVPPLEDMTEFVAKAQSIRAKQQQLQEAPPAKAASTSAQKAKDKPEAKAQPRSEHHPSQFGGMRKGFLFASAKEEPKKQKTAAGKTRQSKPSTSSSAAAAEVPFIKPAEKQKGLELPEVQAAMKASLGSFGSHEWVTDDLIAKIKEHPVLSKAFQDPSLSQVMSQLITNPQAMMTAAQSSPEMRNFMKDFCDLMGDHFSKLADKPTQQSQNTLEDPEVREKLEKPEVRRALQDPRIRELIETLKTDPDKAQSLLKSQGKDFHDNVKVLIDNGLLALQKF